MAINQLSKRQNFINGYVDKVAKLLQDLKDLKEARVEWDSQGYSTGIVDSDFSGNTQLDAAALTSAVTSVQAVTDLLAANGNAHYTNLYKTTR